MTFTLGRERKLRKRADFARGRRVGRRATTAHFVLVIAAQVAGPAPARIGIVAPKAVGGAVERNRIKRLCRECFRQWPGWLPAGVDLVVIARPGAAGERLGLDDVRGEWRTVEGLVKKLAAEALAHPRPARHSAGR